MKKRIIKKKESVLEFFQRSPLRGANLKFKRSKSPLRKTKLPAFLALILAVSPAWSCPHVPADYKSSVKETTKEALIFHDGKYAHLIVKSGLESKGELPNSLAMVIPLPSLPVKYKEESAELFKEIFDYFDRHTPAQDRRGAPLSLPPEATEAMLVHEKIKVGAYEIQPLEIVSDTAGDELNSWLRSQGFNEVPAYEQKFYLRKGAVFLTLKIKGLKGKTYDIRPLHITYVSDSASLPLKFSAGSGIFDVNLYTISSQKDAEDLSNFRLHSEGSAPLNRSILERDAPALLKAIGTVGGYLTQYKGTQYNGPCEGQSVRALKTDPFIMREYSIAERREHYERMLRELKRLEPQP